MSDVTPSFVRATSSDGPASRASRVIEILIALLPVLIIVAYGVALNRFTLIDDGSNLRDGLNFSFLRSLELENVRFRPLRMLYYWILVRLLPAEPWAFSLGNGLFVVAAAAQVQWLARRLAGPLAGIAAAWLFALSLPTIENVFTLGKQEPKQLVFWLAALALLTRLPGSNRSLLLNAALSVCLVGATALFKETGMLLVFPALVATGMLLSEWRDSPSRDWRHAIPLAAVWVVLGLSGVGIALYSLTPSARPIAALAGASAALSLIPLWGHDNHTLLLLVAGLLGGLMLVFRPAPNRALVMLLLVQLVPLVGFFAAIDALMPYYYYPAVAMAAVLAGAALASVSARGRVATAFAVSLFALVAAHGALQSSWAARALSAWNTEYEMLTQSVLTARPARVIFHRSVGLEPPMQALAYWPLLGLPVVVGMLAESDPAPQRLVPEISRRDLLPGDWVIERFGTDANRRVPFRDLKDPKPLVLGLLNEDKSGLLPLRVVRDHQSTFPVPGTNLLTFPTDEAAIRWRIYEVAAAPRFVIEDLSSDYWMHEQAVLQLRADRPTRVRVRFWALAAEGNWQNALSIDSAGMRLALCDGARKGLGECAFVLDPVQVAPDEQGWVTLQLRSQRTFVPARLGNSPDTRALSFNFNPAAGAGVFLEETSSAARTER